MKKFIGSLTMAASMPAVVIINFASPESTDAYLDAGTGSMIIYAIIGAAAGVLLAVKMFWSKICSFLGSIFSKGGSRERLDD